MYYDIVACCSTLPSRVLSGALTRSVRSMLDQTTPPQQIYIHYPSYAKRLKQAYPPVPQELATLPNVTIVPCEDFGPLTKIYPITDLNLDDHTAVVLFDDDRIYPSGWLAPIHDEFVRLGRRVAVGRNGLLPKYQFGMKHRFNKATKPTQVTLLGASWLAMYPRHALPKSSRACIESLHTLPTSAYTNDDIVVATWAHDAKVRLVVSQTTPIELSEWIRVNTEDDIKQAEQTKTRTTVNNRAVRALLHDASALTTSPSQQTKQLGLIAALTIRSKLPCPVGVVFVTVAIFILIVMIIVVPIVVTRRHASTKNTSNQLTSPT